jgi:hypothetical protein
VTRLHVDFPTHSLGILGPQLKNQFEAIVQWKNDDEFTQNATQEFRGRSRGHVEEIFPAFLIGDGNRFFPK